MYLHVYYGSNFLDFVSLLLTLTTIWGGVLAPFLGAVHLFSFGCFLHSSDFRIIKADL